MKSLKKGICFIFVAVLLMACGESKSVKLQNNQVEVNQKVITLNENMSDVIKKLGDYKNMTESKSCLFDGNDKTYEYGSVIVTTYPQNSEDFVSSITVMDKNVKIASDLNVGDSLDKILDTLGDGYTSQDDASCSYEFGDYAIIFYLEDNTVQQYDVYLLQ